MSIALLVITDGRDTELDQTMASASAQLHGPVTERWLLDDTGVAAHRAELARRYPTFEVIDSGPRQGFGGAIQAAWLHLREHCRTRWVFHLEGDFTFDRPVDLGDLASVLHHHPYLVQMALRRQPWNTSEHEAGGVIEQHPQDYLEVTDGFGHTWLEHRLFFTSNPSLYRESLCFGGWPAGRHSEGRFTYQLTNGVGSGEVTAEQVRFGYWGRRHDPTWVTHIGHTRVGTGY